MSEKKVGKRLLTWVLVLVMTLSLLPLNVLADEAGETQDVIQGYYDQNGVWTAGTNSPDLPNGVDSVNKTAKRVGDNTYEVTLQVVLKETTTNVPSQAATVLVIDTSGSMGCEKNEHTHSDTCYAGKWVDCTRENHSDHWENHPILGIEHWTHKENVGCEDNGNLFVSKWQYYVKDDPEVLICGKEAHTHSSACDCRINAAKAAAKNFLDNYRLNATAGRYVALVAFSKYATVVKEWQDVSSTEGYTAILNAINNLSANGGTNLEQGLVNAQNLFADTTVSDIPAKHVIALTDGEPTYYGESVKGEGSYCTEKTFNVTNNAATNLKGVATLHTICFGVVGQPMKKLTQYTVDGYLRDCIATSSATAYSADNAADLNRAFAAISTNITSGLSSGKVKDRLPAGITSTDFGAKTEWNLSEADGFTCTTETTGNTTYYTYTKTYTVMIDPENETVKEIAAQNGGYYPLNGETTLTVGEGVVINFPIPAGKVTLPVPEYTLTFDANGGSWQELSDGSAYTLNESKDKATQKVAANSKPAVVSPIPVKSGFTFDGWYLENDRLYVDFVPIGNSDMTLVAHWKPAATKTYTVIYTDGLTANKAFDDRAFPNLSVDADTPDFGSTPTRSGYVFTGWTPAVAKTVVAPEDGSTVITYTATWEVDNWNSTDNTETGGDGIPDKYQALVKFLPGDPNGKVSGKITQVITMPKTGVEYVSEVKLGNVEEFEVATATPKIGFEFNVWTMNEVTDETKDEAKTTVTPKDVTVKAGSKTTFFAHFKSIPTTYTVTYTDGVGGKAFENQQYSAKYDETTPTFVGTPTREGYKFLDWDPAVAKTVTGDATYTAKWTANDAKITFVTNGGSAVADKDGKTGATIDPRTMPSTSKSGYTFAGWFDNEGLTGTAVTRLPETFPAGTTTYYAKWTRNYTPRPYTPPTVVIPDDDALGLNTTDHFAYIIGYGNGEVRPQNNITRAEVATIFFRLLTDDVRDENLTKTNRYSDVAATSWYNTAVSTLSSMGIITGYPDGTFRPNAAITRAEFAAIAARFDNDGDKTAAKFSDIATHWAKDEISIAYNNGWINGYPDGTFGPQRDITRAETMTLVNRVLNRQPETEDDLLPNMTVWTDNANPNAWYYLAVQEATNSHYYKFKTNSKYEKWTELRETRDWTQLEK